MSVKITRFEAENVKRINMCILEPTQNGLTIIGGKNGQGKTSNLDGLAWLLGGEKYRPTNVVREGSNTAPYLKAVLSNGFVVERKGKNSALKVTDPAGNKSGQQLLNEFVEELSLNLPRFMQSSNREKAETLLKIIGVGEQLVALEQQEAVAYQERLTAGRIADQKKKFYEEQVFYPDAPQDLVSMSELIQQQQAILAKNGENQAKRSNVAALEMQESQLAAQVADLRQKLFDLEGQHLAVTNNLVIARTSIADLQDQSTAELEANISNIEIINAKVRTNLDKSKAKDDAALYAKQYSDLDVKIEAIRTAKMQLLNGARLPLPGLSVADGELTYNGQKWDCMSGADQLRVSTAIVRALNPDCGFVLLDKLEQMDLDTLNEFGVWLESEGLQVIATRVSTGDECSVIIEDGYVVGAEGSPDIVIPASAPIPPAVPIPVIHTTWKAGEF